MKAIYDYVNHNLTFFLFYRNSLCISTYILSPKVIVDYIVNYTASTSLPRTGFKNINGKSHS